MRSSKIPKEANSEAEADGWKQCIANLAPSTLALKLLPSPPKIWGNIE